MYTIFMYETKIHFQEALADLKAEGQGIADRDAFCWFNPEDLDHCWDEALEEMELAYNYIVAVDWDYNVVREHTRKD